MNIWMRRANGSVYDKWTLMTSPPATDKPPLTNADNLNNLTTPGWYRWQSTDTPKNAPDTNNTLMHIDDSGAQALQIAFTGSGNQTFNIWMRRNNGGTAYTDWAKVAGSPTSWVQVSLTGGWDQSNNNPVMYRKTADGMVQLRGVMTDGNISTNAVAFTLPTGYRPVANETFNAAAASANFTLIQIGSNGQVSPRAATDNASSKSLTCLSNIQFYADN
jgi:hypothetical protein